VHFSILGPEYSVLSTSCSCGGDLSADCLLYKTLQPFELSCLCLNVSHWRKIELLTKSNCPGMMSAAVTWITLIRWSRILNSVPRTFYFVPWLRNGGGGGEVHSLTWHPSRNCRRRSAAATLALVVHETDKTYSEAQYAMLLSEKIVPFNHKRGECWFMGYRVRQRWPPNSP
jgi:hypothetical protein